MRRWRGLERGVRWQKEDPEIYGIVKINLHLPRWLNHAIGYECSHLQPFSIFREGDWFDGVNEGVGESDAIALIFESIPEYMDGVLFIFDRQLKTWTVYAAEAQQISAWLELCKWPLKPDGEINEPLDMHITAEKLDTLLKTLNIKDKKLLFRKLKNRLAYKQRLSIFLNARGTAMSNV